MSERAYQVWSHDQQDVNWLTRTISEQGEYAVRSRYLDVYCPQCKVVGLDDAFRLGFDPAIRIRVKMGRTMLVTEDNFLCAIDPVLNALVAAGVKGFESRPIPQTQWHVLSMTERRPFDASIYRAEGRPCRHCGRQGQYGIAQFERQISLPDERLTFFSTTTERGQGGFDRFVTEPLVELLRESGAKGMTYQRLFDAEEEAQIEQRRIKQPSWKPRGSVVVF